MAEAEERRRRRDRPSTALAFIIWFMGWLFTIGYAGLVWWEIILAILRADRHRLCPMVSTPAN